MSDGIEFNSLEVIEVLDDDSDDLSICKNRIDEVKINNKSVVIKDSLCKREDFYMDFEPNNSSSKSINPLPIVKKPSLEQDNHDIDIEEQIKIDNNSFNSTSKKLKLSEQATFNIKPRKICNNYKIIQNNMENENSNGLNDINSITQRKCGFNKSEDRDDLFANQTIIHLDDAKISGFLVGKCKFHIISEFITYKV